MRLHYLYNWIFYDSIMAYFYTGIFVFKQFQISGRWISNHIPIIFGKLSEMSHWCRLTTFIRDPMSMADI